MKHLAILLLLAGALIFGARVSSAQHQIGLNVGYNLDAEEWFAGGQFRFMPAGLPIRINPSVETYFISNLTMLQFDVNAIYPFGADNVVFTPYAGGGLGLSYAKVSNFPANTDAALNLVAGANFGMGRMQPFTEARIAIGDGTTVSVRGGLLIGL